MKIVQRLLLSLGALALLGPLLFGSLERSDVPVDAGPPVDVALVTAIDLSDSIMRHHEWLQFEGVARAVLDPDFLIAVANGRRGRIGFALFTWSSHGRQRLIVPWMLIDGPDGALLVANRIRSAPRPVRFGSNRLNPRLNDGLIFRRPSGSVGHCSTPFRGRATGGR